MSQSKHHDESESVSYYLLIESSIRVQLSYVQIPLISHVTYRRACLMLALEGFPSSLLILKYHSDYIVTTASEEKATLFQQLLEKRRKHFAAKRAEEKRNKPPTKAQQRKIMCTYVKNMEGYKLKDLKLKVFDSIQEMFDRAFKRVNTFEDFRTELVEGKEKRAGTKLSQMYMILSQMPKSFDSEDLYKSGKAKYESTRQMEDLDLLLWGDLKTMFEPHVEDTSRRNQQRIQSGCIGSYMTTLEYKPLRMQHMQIYMLVEKKYPLAPLTLSMMLEKKLVIDYAS
ncbi:hypothetical protein Tco_1261282 [Tanacetum coccineum]